MAASKVRVNRAEARRVARRIAEDWVTGRLRRTMLLAKAMAPVDTGNLRSSGRSRVRVRATKVTGEVSFTARYAEFVHDGSLPHVIVPKHRKALRFTVGGRVVYAKKVHHPGTRGRPFLRRALEAASPDQTVVRPSGSAF